MLAWLTLSRMIFRRGPRGRGSGGSLNSGAGCLDNGAKALAIRGMISAVLKSPTATTSMSGARYQRAR